MTFDLVKAVRSFSILFPFLGGRSDERLSQNLGTVNDAFCLVFLEILYLKFMFCKNLYYFTGDGHLSPVSDIRRRSLTAGASRRWSPPLLLIHLKVMKIFFLLMAVNDRLKNKVCGGIITDG